MTSRITTSILILTYNKLEYTQVCIDSIRRYTEKGTYQIIVVDNASTDETRQWLAEQTDILTIFNESNVGFPKGCNQGIEIANGDSILLLNNDVVVTEGWLEKMNECLFSSSDIGAVGPVSNSAYGEQEIPVSYTSLDEMWGFANQYNMNSLPNWKQKLKLIGFCMLIKREALEEVGGLDERFSPGMCEDSDYSVRLTESNYRLMLCENVFIHHFGSTSFSEMKESHQELWQTNRAKFEEKWGFHTAYHMQSRKDLVAEMNPQDKSRAIKVLDIGCACGATLLEVKNEYPLAELYGIERNEHAAKIASKYAQVVVGDIEQSWPYAEEEFDYIIVGDVLHYLNNPGGLFANTKYSLKPSGNMILSVPNASNYINIYNLLKGESLSFDDSNKFSATYSYTLNDLQKITKKYFDNIKYTELIAPTTENEDLFISRLADLVGNPENRYKVVKYIISANNIRYSNEILTLLKNIYANAESVYASHLTDSLSKKDISITEVINHVQSINGIDHQDFLNTLVRILYKAQLVEDIIPLLNASLEIDNSHVDTLFNFAAFLYNMEAYEQALFFANMISNPDESVLKLINNIKTNLN